MTTWESASSHKDPIVEGLFAHFLSAIDLMEIMNQEEDWLTKVWAKKLYINLMDLRCLEVYQSATLAQEVKNRIRLNEISSGGRQVVEIQVLPEHLPCQDHLGTYLTSGQNPQRLGSKVMEVH
jgi:hypothetical protein